MSDPKKLTTTAGAPIADNQNALTAGPRGPVLMQGVPEFIIERQLKHFEKVHPDCAAGVRAALAAIEKKAR